MKRSTVVLGAVLALLPAAPPPPPGLFVLLVLVYTWLATQGG